jgi:hypothetical protein
MTLPTDAAARKAVPIATGCLDYFPNAIAAIAELSRIGNEQHNPGTPLHWDRSKSGDESDAAMRHFLERGRIDTDGVRHSTKFAWRALALLEKELEAAAQTGKVLKFPTFANLTPASEGSFERDVFELANQSLKSSLPRPHHRADFHLDPAAMRRCGYCNPQC